ncbi:dihydroneopterin aldolase [Acinetobacter rudis]|uniref:7,8-dihydroneopterin aldolase n=1 Tax=Acinetobacter rudis TaxID=632955 RepID=A0AAW8JAC6_9GAMM|nr:dihydroneopterin aldolase [Acinetobacter rudis]MDQ8936740.1 dihydroneopterin aldolase [Acinetobacter rudis]MDQ9018961.1 dihydroneopterin aldolase [Acinetobacter rudis]
MDEIFIEDLRVDTIVGCFTWERQIIQPLSLDITVRTCLKKVAHSDELDDTLNYALMCEIATETIQQAKPKMLEHAAQLVVEQLFIRFDAIESIRIAIRKPAIIAQAQAVGIRFERHRHDLCTRIGE